MYLSCAMVTIKKWLCCNLEYIPKYTMIHTIYLLWFKLYRDAKLTKTYRPPLHGGLDNTDPLCMMSLKISNDLKAKAIILGCNTLIIKTYSFCWDLFFIFVTQENQGRVKKKKRLLKTVWVKWNTTVLDLFLTREWHYIRRWKALLRKGAGASLKEIVDILNPTLNPV